MAAAREGAMKKLATRVMKLPEWCCRLLSGGKTVVDGQLLDGRAQLLLHELEKRYEPYESMEPVEARAYLDDLIVGGPSAPGRSAASRRTHLW